ncbi:uncharacterized protein LOC119665462 [Teleopsis dalmanni]|uniref:uncharacterized protein LOC119665462 n=1 Tax=Teleopsis dalmanni TaxID=139649 RepID=UPI0018CD5010|nr:uncharacterized protein LOC119665462 [Teleopsis dalmanni]
MNDLRSTQTAHHSSGKVFIEKDLYSSDQVFVRNSMICKPLQAPYEGPFTVLKRFDKYFVVDVKGRKVNISVDRLKAAFSEQYFKEQEVKPLVTDKNDHKTYTSRYGRKVVQKFIPKVHTSRHIKESTQRNYANVQKRINYD